MPYDCEIVIPADAGIQPVPPALDPGVRRDDVSMRPGRDIHTHRRAFNMHNTL
jgi:hypothetical protein